MLVPLQKMQLLWYLMHVLMCNPETQKFGLVVLANARGGSLTGYDTKFSYRSSCFYRYFPIQCHCAHLCFANVVLPFVVKAIKIAAPNCKDSFILHNGSEERVLACLSQHNLPKQCIPEEMGGTLRVSTMAFLHDRLTVEGGVILKPSGNDARDLSLSDSDDNGCTSTMDNEVIGGLNSDDSVCAAPAATSCRAPVSENSPRSEDQAADPSDSCFSCAHTCPQHEGQGSTHAVTAKNDDTITISPEVKDAVEAASVSVLKEKLADIPHDEKSALVHVQRVAPALVNDNHLLIFLRHKGFDVDSALKALVHFWGKRSKVFGLEKYTLPMTLCGAMKDNIEVLKKGYMVILPILDEAGRPILWIDGNALSSHTTVDDVSFSCMILLN